MVLFGTSLDAALLGPRFSTFCCDVRGVGVVDGSVKGFNNDRHALRAMS